MYYVHSMVMSRILGRIAFAFVVKRGSLKELDEDSTVQEHSRIDR